MDARRDLEKKANGPISSYWFTLDEGNENEPLLVLDSDVELDEAEKALPEEEKAAILTAKKEALKEKKLEERNAERAKIRKVNDEKSFTTTLVIPPEQMQYAVDKPTDIVRSTMLGDTEVTRDAKFVREWVARCYAISVKYSLMSCRHFNNAIRMDRDNKMRLRAVS